MTVDSLFRKTGVLALTCACVLAFAGFASLDFLSARRLDQATLSHRLRHRAEVRGQERLPYAPEGSDVSLIRSAIAFAPTAAEPRDQLARTSHRIAVRAGEWTAEERQEMFQTAESGYRRAVRLNQADGRAYFWRAMLHRWAVEGGLGPLSAAMIAEHAALVDRSLAAAGRLRPYDPQIAYETGAWLLSKGDDRAAFGAFSRSAAVTQRYLAEIVDALLDRPGGIAGLDAIVPDDASSRLAVADILFSRNRTDEAYRYWRSGRELAGEEARETGSLVGAIANGGFEHPLGETFHDWSVEPVAGVSWSRVPDEVSGGGSAFRIDFDRAPANHFHATQVVPVASLASYRLSARVRSEGLPAGERVGVEVLAAGSGSYLCGDARPPAAAWAEVDCEFRVPRMEWAVRVRVRKSAEEGTESSGFLEIDDVTLVELPAGAAK